MSTVTVFIPTFNRHDWLRECLASVLNQEGVDLQVLVLDNGSTDKGATKEVLRKASKMDSRVMWSSNEVNDREVWRYLRGIHTDYVSMFCDDDRMLPGGLAAKVAMLDAHPRTNLVYSPMRVINAVGDDRGIHGMGNCFEGDTPEGAAEFSTLILGDYVPFPTIVFRSSLSWLFESSNLPDIGGSIDWSFLLLMLAHGEFGFVKKPTVEYRVHDQQDSEVWGRAENGFAKAALALWGHWMCHGWRPSIEDTDRMRYNFLRLGGTAEDFKSLFLRRRTSNEPS